MFNNYLVIGGILVGIIVLAIIWWYFKSESPAKLKPAKGWIDWTHPSMPDPSRLEEDEGHFSTTREVNIQVIEMLDEYPDKTPVLTKSLIKNGAIILQLTVFEDCILDINNSTGTTRTIPITTSELEIFQELKEDMEQNPINCGPDVGGHYPMTYITLHSANTKTYYADGTCDPDTLGSYRKLNQMLLEKLDFNQDNNEEIS